MANKSEHTKKAVKEALIEAMQKAMGVVTEACKIAKVGRTTFYKLYNNDPEFKRACDECQDIALDFAESQLYSQIKGGSTTATIFYLKTKGKHRGYVERQQIDINKGQPDLSHLTSDELVALLENE
tara:strand:- start:9 stop:386 length:378 start_codon:yes stop_codon:yes gene_type:complete